MRAVFMILFYLLSVTCLMAQGDQHAVERKQAGLRQKTNSKYSYGQLLRISKDSSQHLVKEEPSLILAGFVFDEKTYDPVKASIRIERANKVLKVGHSDPEYGEYSTSLPGGGKYIIRVSAEGYLAATDSIELEATIAEDTEIYKDLFLMPIEAGLSVRLNSIFFDYDKTSLRPESFPELDRVVALMKQNPHLQIEIGGHTDHRGSDDYNQKLSQGRAEAVRQYLLENRIGGERVIAVGYGESHPVVSNNTEANMQTNRSVVFTVLKNK